MALPIALPSLSRAPRQFEWWKQSNTQEGLESPLDKSVQDLELPGAMWRAIIDWPPMVEMDAAKYEAFLNSLRGSVGRFTLFNRQRPVPNGTIGTAGAAINGNQPVAASLNLKSITAGRTLLAGDYIGFNTELRQVIANATANGSGLMTVTLDCPFRNPVTDGMAVVTDRPTGIFKLLTDETPRLVKNVDKMYESASLECREVW